MLAAPRQAEPGHGASTAAKVGAVLLALAGAALGLPMVLLALYVGVTNPLGEVFGVAGGGGIGRAVGAGIELLAAGVGVVATLAVLLAHACWRTRALLVLLGVVAAGVLGNTVLWLLWSC